MKTFPILRGHLDSQRSFGGHIAAKCVYTRLCLTKEACLTQLALNSPHFQNKGVQPARLP